MPIVLRDERLTRRSRRLRVVALPLGIAAAVLAGAVPASAQLSAALSEKKNVVKYSKNNAVYLDAPLKQALGRGDYVVTGARSLAGVLYSDKTYLRINESSKAQITVGTHQRDATLQDKTGAIYGKYNGPGRVVGQQALCAVRGTEFEFLADGKKDVVRCFGPQGHQVFVTGAKNALITGRITTPGAAQVSSEDLIGNGENWVGAKLEIVTGNDARQSRTVTNFDPGTGTLTLNAPLPNANNLNEWFYVVNPPGAKIVVLDKDMETYIGANGDPVNPYATEPKEFAGGEQFAFMNDKLRGNSQTNLSGFFFEQQRHANYELDNARDSSQNYSNEAPGIQILSGSDQRGTNHQPGVGNLGVGVGSTNQAGQGNIGVGIGNGNPNGTGGLNVQIGPSRAIFARVPEFGGVGFSTTGSDAALAYANDSAVIGSVYMRVGGRIGTLERATDNQLDELLLRYRNRHIGDIQVGRFHWLPGPISNDLIGKLISFTSTDGVLWDLPETGAYSVQLGWFDKINPLSDPNVSGYSARLTIPAKTGQLGVTTLTTSQKTVGATGDFVYPILPQQLEVYGEGGVDTQHQTVYAAGLYFPQLFHKFRTDFSVELAYRGHFGHSVDLALHTPITRYATALITLSKPGAAGWRPGIGLQAHY